ncbi:hypothetical protein SNE40_021585 [Patella caerulea]|uniref:BPL/LPL catalytic domain-containing protein n=1 Tax=Patella caerulea TaxID=87958 RepID=A0AAN8G4Q8_PATCE
MCHLKQIINIRKLLALTKVQPKSVLYSTKCREKEVIISKSKNIFENLALEDWLYKNADLNNRNYLFMWRNTPAVVVGRHQNPWLECDVTSVLREKVDLARRNSGGGTVFHDEGNLNCCFLTTRKLYNRKSNLELVVDALTSNWDIDLSINKREDIVLNGLYKISGTAAKLGGERSYHHFTLLINVNKKKLHNLLQSPLIGVKTRATESVPSHIMNLQDVNEDINYENLTHVISDKFLENDLVKRKEFVNPTEDSYPGYNIILNELKTFKWIYAKTPNFKISRAFRIEIDSKIIHTEIEIEIQKGLIYNIEFSLKPNNMDLTNIVNRFKDVPYDTTELLPILDVLENENNDAIYKWFLRCIKQTLNV